MQSTLFGEPAVPEGFSYTPDFLSPADEHELLDRMRLVDFSRVEMSGGVARRRVVQYGRTYGFSTRRASPGRAIPEWLVPLRARAAEWAGLDADALEEALVTEYPQGAPIGWHRDAPMFEDVIGISLAGACRMKFRPYVSPRDLGGAGRSPRRTTHELELAPRSIYLMRGVVRREFEHSIPPVGMLRYSVTFRTMR